MKLSDIRFQGAVEFGYGEHSVWFCEHCRRSNTDDYTIKAGDTLTCPHCDSTYYVEAE